VLERQLRGLRSAAARQVPAQELSVSSGLSTMCVDQWLEFVEGVVKRLTAQCHR
jgi:hypothetical protein